jgi:DNA-binding NarL/FixJ family response regulator
VFKNTYTHNGRSVRVKAWSVKIQHLGQRRTLSLRSTRRAEAEREAARLHRRIIAHGWASTVSSTKVLQLVSTADQGASKTVAYWKARLLQRRYPAPNSRDDATEWSARIEHDGQAHYFPLGTSSPRLAASRALKTYQLVVRKGWAAASQKHAREVTLALHWAMEPVAWTYTTLHTLRHVRAGLSPNQPRIKVALLESEPSLRDALEYWINQHAALRCVRTVASGAAAIEHAADHSGLLWLVNSAVGGEPKGRDWLARLSDSSPETCGLMYSLYEDSNQVFLAAPGGASGYMLKRTPADRFLDPITLGGVPDRITADLILSRVRQYFQAALAFAPVPSSSVVPLTTREHEILELVGKGYVDKEIAARLGISPWTVHGHMKNIFEKLSVHSRTEAVVRSFHK